MKIPANIRIAGHDFTVVLEDNPFFTVPHYGHCSPDQQKITLAAGMSESRGQETFIHEVLHAAVATYQIDLPNEEEVVALLAVALHQIFRDNPKVLKFLEGSKDEK